MKRKKLFLAGAILIISAVGVAGYINLQDGKSVETSVVEKGEIKQYIEDTAVVQSNKKQTVYIEGSGKISSINVNVGEHVKKGDILLTMDKKDLELKLQDANSKIEAAKAQLSSTDSSNFGSKIEIAEADVDKANVTYESTSRDFNNAKTLYESGAISKKELDTAEDAYKSADATLKSAKAQLDDVKKGSPDYIRNGYMAEVEQAIILRDSIMRDIEKQEVIAPIDGTILEKSVDENSIVAAGALGFLIGDTNSLELNANILSDNINKVKIGDEVEISGNAIEDSTLKGKVVKIAPEAKNITSSLGVNQKRVDVTIEIKDDASLLKPGYDLDIKIITDIKNDTLIIPDSAVFDYQGSSSVFVVGNGKAIIRQIKKGIESEKTIEVIDGLKEGDVILTKPDNSTKEGIKIKV
jgi:HlyD family secretion protein